ncbi:MAG: hypothetical protein IPJ34_02725 [Myxococcales bacterium]|nr:hypothetical protein [Myxococcales bacterium]
MRRWCPAVLVLSIGCGGTTADESSDAATDGAPGDAAVDTSVTDTGAADAQDGGGDSGSTDSGSPDSGSPDVGPDVPLTGCITDKSAGTHVFKCAGVTYDVTIPAACTTKACGLVLDVHGATMTGRMEDANTQMRALGDKYGYVVIQPTAPGSAPTTSWTPGIDDDKVHSVLVEAIAVLGVDAKRVHMTGFSQGGMMTSRFLCRFAELFASVAPAAGTGCSFFGLDTPSREVPVLYLHGTKDVLVAFTEGVKQRDAAVAAWKMSGPTTLSSDASHSRKQWTSAKGTVFEFVQHDYKAPPVTLQGHCYPGSTDKGGEPGQLFSFACTPPSAFVWGEEVMKFFVAHPRT